MKTVWKRCLAAALSVLLINACAENGGQGLPVHVLSFNIRYDNPHDGENRWRERKEKAAETIRFHHIHLAGIQEALHHQVMDLAGSMPEFEWFGAGRDDGETAGEYAPVFYLKSRFDLVFSDHFWLSETPEKPSMGWDAACMRIVSWGKLYDKWTRRHIYIVNTHFDHIGKTARRKSAELLLNKINEKMGGAPVILTGDFNCTPEDTVYSIITAGTDKLPGLKDARFLTDRPAYGSTFTFNGFKPDIHPNKYIDYIFVKNVKGAGRFGIISTIWDGYFASDHFPVAADIILK